MPGSKGARRNISNDPRRRTPQRELKAPKFVTFHPRDNAVGCDEIFWEDPLTFTPRRGRSGYIDSWGIYPRDSDGFRDVDGPRIAERTHAMGKIYPKEHLDQPEVQFINALIKRKVTLLRETDLQDLPRRDYTLYISLPVLPHPNGGGQDRYWRRIKLSGGIPLGVFADKVITPIWGWIRNLHAHVFTDFKDGALFGPKDCDAVDIMHLDKSGYAYIPEEGYCIAHILQKPGDAMGFHYDFGDNWFVDVKLEEVAPSEDSTGAILVLDGAGGTLPDGENIGTYAWARYLKAADRSMAAKQHVFSVLFGAHNYRDKARLLNPAVYDLDAFDLEGCRRAVREALDSKASVPQASKHFVASMEALSTRDPLETLLDSNELVSRVGARLSHLKRGVALAQTPVGTSGITILEEGVSESRKDNPANTACAYCGSPHNLKACAGCMQRYYCGKSCQTAHWKEQHKHHCKTRGKKSAPGN